MRGTNEVRVFRASVGGYVGFGIIFAIAIGMSSLVATRDPRPASWLVLGLVLSAAFFVSIWLRAFRLEITDSTLTYATLFSRRTILLRQIERVELSVRPLASPAGPTVRLTLSLQGQMPPLVVNAKVFEKRVVRLVLELAPGTDRVGY